MEVAEYAAAVEVQVDVPVVVSEMGSIDSLVMVILHYTGIRVGLS